MFTSVSLLGGGEYYVAFLLIETTVALKQKWRWQIENPAAPEGSGFLIHGSFMHITRLESSSAFLFLSEFLNVVRRD